MEDKPLLPVGVDGVDRREWTLQHHKAADITLTPPQADNDMESLDVNVHRWFHSSHAGIFKKWQQP